MKRYLSSEYVGIGHPDKIADQISDSILDLYLLKDKDAHVAVETLVSGNKVVIAGEITSHANIFVDEIRDEIVKTVEEIGYGPLIPCEFRSDNLDIQIYIKPQSPNISDDVNRADGNIGAGDQGIMFGYAINETPKLLPLPYVVAADLLLNLNTGIKQGEFPGFYPDNKSQVCCLYQNGKLEIEKIILSTFHSKDIPIAKVRQMIADYVIYPTLDNYSKYLPENDDPVLLLINSAGPFWIGGPDADAGLTGRKIIVDTYGGFAPHGGGAFSGKDPTKVDRSANYMARHIAKSLVANGYANEALVQLSYAIGDVRPFSIAVRSDSKISEDLLIERIKDNFDLSPKGIIDYLKLTDASIIKYKNVACGGHFLDQNLPWEQIKAF